MGVPLLELECKGFFAPLLNDQQITLGNIRNDTESVNRVSTLTRCDPIATANYRLAGMRWQAAIFEEEKNSGRH
jgi:hypothetical protein